MSEHDLDLGLKGISMSAKYDMIQRICIPEVNFTKLRDCKAVLFLINDPAIFSDPMVFEKFTLSRLGIIKCCKKLSSTKISTLAM